MADMVWTIRASKSDLEDLLKDIRRFEEQQGTGVVIPPDGAPRRVPIVMVALMGQMEEYELVLAPILGAGGNALYEGVKLLIRKFVEARPNQASFSEKPKT